MKTSFVPFVSLLTALLLAHAAPAVGAPGVTPAADAEKRKAALTSLREGNALLDEGEPAGALVKFRQAMALYPSPKLHFNIAQALHGLPGRHAEAYAAFRRFLAEAPEASAATRGEAERKLIELESSIALLTLTVEPPGAQIFVNGAARGSAPLAGPLALDPGEHRVRVEHPGRVPYEDVIRVLAREHAVRAVNLPPPSAGAPPAVFRPVRPLSRDVSAPADGDGAVQANLLASAQTGPPATGRDDTPVYTRWWLWAGVAGVVVAGVATALLISGGGNTLVHDCSSSAAPSTGTCDPLP